MRNVKEGVWKKFEKYILPCGEETSEAVEERNCKFCETLDKYVGGYYDSENREVEIGSQGNAASVSISSLKAFGITELSLQVLKEKGLLSDEADCAVVFVDGYGEKVERIFEVKDDKIFFTPSALCFLKND